MTQNLNPVRGGGGQRPPTSTPIQPESITVATGTYRIDPVRSRLRFTIKETFGLMTTRGTFTIRDGTVKIAADPATSSAAATIDAASFKTDKAKRDRTVVSKSFLDATTYPTIRFDSTAVQQDGTAWVVPGWLTVRGKATPVTLTIGRAAATVDGCRFTATARVDRYATPVRAGRGLIGRYLDIELDVYAVAL
jgi:polyisoprenoid-binding protein YceI